MVYNMDFLMAAMVIMLLILWYFLGQKRADDLNTRVFFFFAVIGSLDVAFELLSTCFITSGSREIKTVALFVTTIFYMLQALLPVTIICYIQTLHDNKIVSAKRCFYRGCQHFFCSA